MIMLEIVNSSSWQNSVHTKPQKNLKFSTGAELERNEGGCSTSTAFMKFDLTR
jgi:hypothetical protein